MEVKENIVTAMQIRNTYGIDFHYSSMTDVLSDNMRTVDNVNLNIVRLVYKLLNKKLSDINRRIYGS